MSSDRHPQSAESELPFKKNRLNGNHGRFPDKQEMYSRLHALFSGRLPDPDLFDEAMELFESLSPVELNKIRRKQVQEMLRERFSELHSFQEFVAGQTAEAVSRRVIDTQSEMNEFMATLGQNLDCLFDDEHLILLTQDVLTHQNISRFIQELASNNISYAENISYVARIRDWSQEKCIQFLGRIIVKMMRGLISHAKNGQVPLSTLYNACNECLWDLQKYFQSEQGYIPTGIAHKLRLEQRSEETPDPFLYAEQNREDRSKIAEVSMANDQERSRLLIANLHKATDKIRTTVIPELLQQNVSAREAFWAIHRAHFDENPFLSHMHTSSFNEVPAYARNSGGDDFYQQSIGQTRRNFVSSGWTGHLESHYLPVLEEKFFLRLEEAMGYITSEEEFLDLVTKVDMFMITAHLPFDGAGRTYEDFMVYLGKRAGYPLTVSVSGYRNASSAMVEDRMKADDDYKKERDGICLRNLGIMIDPTVKRSEWKAYTQGLLKEKYAEKWEAISASEQALEAQRIINAVASPGDTDKIAQQYRSFQELRHVWQAARSQSYIIASSSHISAECDELMAESTVNYTLATQAKFAALEQKYPEDPLVRQIAEQHLRPRTPHDMLVLARLFHREKKTGKAIDLYERALEMDPKNTDALNELGLLHEDQGKDNDAETFYRRAIKANELFEHAYNNLGFLLMQRPDQQEEAEALLLKTITLKPRHTAAHYNLALLYKKQDKTEKAIEYFQKFLEIKPSSISVRTEFADYLLQTGRDDALLEKQFDEILEWQPQNIIALFQLARYYRRKDKPRKAQLYYEELLRIDPSHINARMNLGMLLRGAQQYEASESQFRIIIQQNADFEAAYLGLAITYLSKNDHAACRQVLEEYVAKGFSVLRGSFRDLAEEVGFQYPEHKQDIWD
ncbi:MAG: hypothetical protein JWM56_151 [Candidatus Peribacteria bacterium]|nr:hypothetical protein [Candidatus Peribacteria bacterium]